MRLTVTINIPRPSFQPQVDVAHLMERFAWALHREAEQMGVTVMVEGAAVAIDSNTLLVTELKKEG